MHLPRIPFTGEVMTTHDWMNEQRSLQRMRERQQVAVIDKAVEAELVRDSVGLVRDWSNEVRRWNRPLGPQGLQHNLSGTLSGTAYYPRRGGLIKERNREASNKRKGRLLSLFSRTAQVVGRTLPRFGRVQYKDKTVTFLTVGF